jgi:hypothetical protein
MQQTNEFGTNKSRRDMGVTAKKTNIMKTVNELDLSSFPSAEACNYDTTL